MPYKDPIKAKEHARLRQRKYRLFNPIVRKREKENRKKRYLLNREKEIQYNKEFLKNNKDRQSAYNKLFYAIKVGKIIKPKICSRCGATERIQGHHKDYSKPYDVEWFCHKCHMKEDKCLVLITNFPMAQKFPELLQ